MNILTVQEVRQCIDYLEEAMALIGITNEYLKNKDIQQKVFNVQSWNFENDVVVGFERDGGFFNYNYKDKKQFFHIACVNKTVLKYNWDYTTNIELNVVLLNDTVTSHISLNKDSDRIIFRKSIISDIYFEYEMMDMTDPDTEMFLFQESLVQKVEVINALMFAFEWRRRKLPNIQMWLGADPLNHCEGVLNIIKLMREQYGFNGYNGYTGFEQY
jgi:hypothetical protein